MRLYITLLFICFTNFFYAQKHELGIFLGGTNYIGDIGKTSYIYPNELSGGIVYKLNLNPRIALRANASYFPISGNDNASNNSFRNEREYDFTNRISELAAGIEFNFLDYRIDTPSKTFTPYILAQIAVFNYKIVTDYSLNSVVYDNRNSFTLPVGIGFKGKLIGKFAYAFESGIRFTITDELDYTTDRIDELNFGGHGDDFYVFTGFSLIYSFGRPPCYAPLD